MASLEFEGYANVWWEEVNKKREKEDLAPIDTWEEMQEVMHTRFVPTHHKRDLFNKLTQLKQSYKSVEEYYKEMHMTMMSANVDEREEQTMARFLNGLNIPVKRIVEFLPYKNMVELLHQATRAERQVREDLASAKTKTFFAARNAMNASSSIKNTSTLTSKDPPKQARSTIKTTSFKPEQSTMSSKASTGSSNITCFKCGAQGHKSFECKNTRVMITRDDGDVEYLSEGEYEALVQAATTHEDDDLEDQEQVLCVHDASPSLVVTKVLTTHALPNEDQRCNIFQTRAGINGKSIKVIIDGGSCHNLASTELCTKLNLPLRKHPHPYHVQWLSDNGNVKIQHTVTISFKIGAYEDTIDCDVVPMTVCHMLLGRPWQYDKKANHDGYTNAYSFKVNDKTYILRPMTPSQVIADNAKALARAKEATITSELRGERVIHQKESERHKPYVSEMKSVLLATKSEMREVHHNPSTTLHYVLICKGPSEETNDLTNIPSSLLSLLKEFHDVFPDELPHGLPPLRGIEHRIDLIPGAPLPNRAAYRTNPEDTKEIQRQIQDLLAKGFPSTIYTPILETNMYSEDEPTEDDMEYYEGDSSASAEDMEDHVELDTDNGSACIGDMTDIELFYTDHDSPSMDNMVDHHSELDHDYDYDDMVEHYLEHDIDTMVEPSFDPTLNKTDGATMRVLTHMIIYIELVRWNNKSVPAMIAIDTLLRAQEGTTSKVPSHMNHHLGMPRIVINTRRLMIVVDYHHPMTTIDMHHHMTVADTSHLMFAIDQHLPRIFDDTPQDMHMTWECNTPQAHKLYFAQLDAQFANMTLQDTIVFKEWCKEMDKMTTMKPTLQDGAREGQDKSDVDSSLALNNTIAPSNGVNMGGDGVEKVEHGIFPSTKEANGVENGEHGMIPSPMEAHGDEKIEPTPICLNDEMVPIPCEHESHLAHLSESDSELSDSHPICEYECFHLEDMSDTPSSMEDEFPIMEKMYMVHEDDAITPCLLEDEHGGHMEPTTSTTPTSNESDYKGLLTSDGTFKRGCHLPPIHVHEELSSRTTLFQVGGDDAARPSVFTASCASSPRRHAKVNLLLYACLESPTWNDILLHTPSYLDDRNSTTSTGRRKDGTETRGRKADVTEAWKRRRKRSWKLQGRHCRPTQAGTAARAGTAALPTPALPPWS
ncbi:hypothetical protein QYE76_018549 [Lolium multiflorum]|uniref:CCHC-type domain-containing protein n=1 Tax=Lolium multiflorum TaxID=4521 RepID=A0AAD8V979_LOLMU|nr:hypothetical protein QYE76_018549 [Lolium multiflorum]